LLASLSFVRCVCLLNFCRLQHLRSLDFALRICLCKVELFLQILFPGLGFRLQSCRLAQSGVPIPRLTLRIGGHLDSVNRVGGGLDRKRVADAPDWGLGIRVPIPARTLAFGLWPGCGSIIELLDGTLGVCLLLLGSQSVVSFFYELQLQVALTLTALSGRCALRLVD
jgi:hypothetical protein